MNRNFLKGVVGDEMNVLLAAAAMNFKRVMNLWKQGLLNLLFKIAQLIIETLCYKLNFKMTF
jgi:IS5 family transposase